MDRASSRAASAHKTKKSSRPAGTIETNQTQQAPLPASGAEPRPSTSSLQPSTPKPPRAGPMRGPMAPNANAIMQPPKMTTTSSAISINHSNSNNNSNSNSESVVGQRAALKLGPRPATVLVNATANKQAPAAPPQKVAWPPARGQHTGGGGGVCFPAPDSPSTSLAGHCPPLVDCSLATSSATVTGATNTTTTGATNSGGSDVGRLHMAEAGGLNSDELSECSCNSLDCLTTDLSQSPTSSQLDQPPMPDVMMQQLPGHPQPHPHHHQQHHQHNHYLPAPLQVHHHINQQQLDHHHHHHNHHHDHSHPHHHHNHHHHNKPQQLHHQQMHGDSPVSYHQQTLSNSNKDSPSLSQQHRPAIGPASTHPGGSPTKHHQQPHPQQPPQPPPLVRHSTYTAGTDTITDDQHHHHNNQHHHQRQHQHHQQPHASYQKSLSPPPPPSVTGERRPLQSAGAPNSDFIPTNQQVYSGQPARNNNNDINHHHRQQQHHPHRHQQPDHNSQMMDTQEQHYKTLRPAVSFRRAATIREPVNQRWRTQQQHDQHLLFDYNNNQGQHQLIEQTPLERSYCNGTNSLQRQKSAASVAGAYGSQQSSSSATPRIGLHNQNPNPSRLSMRNNNSNSPCPPPPTSPFLASSGTRISTPHNSLTNSNPPTGVYFPGSPIPPPQSQLPPSQIQPQPPPAPPPALPALAPTASLHSNHRAPHHMSMAASPFEGAPFCPLPAITSHRTNSPWMRISSIIATPIGIVIILFIVISPLLHYLM